MATHARLKNEFTDSEKCHNLMSWLNLSDKAIVLPFAKSPVQIVDWLS